MENHLVKLAIEQMENRHGRVEEEHNWGYADIICSTGKKLYVNEGGRSTLHHDVSLYQDYFKDFYVDKGVVLLELEDTPIIMYETDSIKIHRDQVHRFTALREAEIIEFCSPERGEKEIDAGPEGGEILPEKQLNEIWNKYFPNQRRL